MSEPKPPTTPPDVHIDIEATLPDVHFDVDATLPDVHFDVDAKRPYIIPRHQNSGISLERQDFYFEINLKDKPSTGHKFKNSDEAFDITGSSSISFVTPLKATIARLFVSNLNDLLPSSVVETPSEKTLPKTLEFKKPPAIIPCQGQPNRSLKVAHKDQSQECQVEILGVNKRRAETVDIVKPSIPLVKPSISPKHASRYIQYAGETYQSRTFHVYLKSLKEVMESTDNKKFLMNEVEPKTRTSTFGHIIRGPPTEVVSRVQTVLKANAYRPLFYDTELWDASALTEALSVGNFEVVEDIVRSVYFWVPRDRH
ncbi:hypothetical protein BC938DRAFT_472021 [Jimgerdemannia flammicorona]|uniref:Uncharacterized protein n=1 Tax=Jimgerdemannia flammicorona TaxID=994334 RepID=A0A433Q6W9_9FUNG|nr:hypothetical protein BC938DRAFT_472021 [Jimgerdemannia flammicorona]